MSTEVEFPGVHYFCVDVETSALRPSEGSVLSVGMVVMDADGNVVDHYYSRVQAKLGQSWYNESVLPESDTQVWWRAQDDFVKDEAYRDDRRPRLSASVVGSQLRNMVLSYGADWTDRLFVASPVSFDRMWVEELFFQAGRPDPFHYHTLDMHSMLMASQSTKRQGSNKGLIDPKKQNKTHDSEIPHHALADAFALAQDLTGYLKNSIIDLDIPSYEYYDEYTADLSAELAEEVWSEGEMAVEEEVAVEEEPDEEVEPVLDIEEPPEAEPESD
jgi:DNA polymerase III epsilon subunit-like protein